MFQVSNSVVNWTLSTAESTVYKAVEQAWPIANKFEGPIHTVDSILSKGLDIVEDKVPVVKLPPQQVSFGFIFKLIRHYQSATLNKPN